MRKYHNLLLANVNICINIKLLKKDTYEFWFHDLFIILEMCIILFENYPIVILYLAAAFENNGNFCIQLSFIFATVHIKIFYVDIIK